MTNKLDQVYNKLRGRKLCGLEAQCFDGGERALAIASLRRKATPSHQSEDGSNSSVLPPATASLRPTDIGSQRD